MNQSRKGVMNVTMEQPLEKWDKLYRAAIALRDLAPWTWLPDEPLFAVENPADGEILYCSIMGGLGQLTGLAVYPGAAGWASLCSIWDAGDSFDTDAMFGQTSFTVTFEGSGDVDERDRAMFKQLGLRFRGDGKWPVVRRSEPGYVAEHVDESQIDLLTCALEQAVEVGRLTQQDPLLLDSDENADAEQLLLRRVVDGRWISEVVPMPEQVSTVPALPTVQIDETELRRIKRSAKPSGVWEVDFTFAPMGIEEDGRVMHPRILLVVHVDSGMALGVHLAGPEYPQAFADYLTSVMKESRMYPTGIAVARTSAHSLFQPIANALGAELMLVQYLPYLEELRNRCLIHLDNHGAQRPSPRE